MKRFMKHFRYGEKGFTLIELLVVVAILGVLAAVAIPNVGKFMGKGKLEAANTEMANVLTSVMAAMSDNNVSALTDAGTVGPAHASSVTYPPDTTTLAVHNYFTGNLEATYTLNTEGSITSATIVADGKWKGLEWDADKGCWKKS